MVRKWIVPAFFISTLIVAAVIIVMLIAKRSEAVNYQRVGVLEDPYFHLDHPQVTVTRDNGKIFVASHPNKLIRYNPDGSIYLTHIIEDESVNLSTCRLACDNNYLYISDSSNNKVYSYTHELRLYNVSGIRGSGDGQFKGPAGIALDQAGYIYVADTGNFRVQKMKHIAGKLGYYAKWGSEGYGSGQFKMLDSVACFDSGAEHSIFVSDDDKNKISEWTPTGAFIREFSFSPHFDDLDTIAVDLNKQLYVLNSTVQAINVYDASVKPVKYLYNVRFPDLDPKNFALSPFGDLYLADWGRNEVVIYKIAGK